MTNFDTTNFEKKPSVIGEDENRDLGFGARVTGGCDLPFLY